MVVNRTLIKYPNTGNIKIQYNLNYLTIFIEIEP